MVDHPCIRRASGAAAILMSTVARAIRNEYSNLGHLAEFRREPPAGTLLTTEVSTIRFQDIMSVIHSDEGPHHANFEFGERPPVLMEFGPN